MTTTGTTIGETKNISSARRKRNWPRPMPMAASVPRTVAVTAVDNRDANS